MIIFIPQSLILFPYSLAEQSVAVFPPVRISVDTSSVLYMEPGSEGQLVVTLQNDGPNDTICISGKDDQDIFFDFDDEQ